MLPTKYQIPVASTVTTGSAPSGIRLCLWLPTKAISGKDRMHQHRRCRGLDVETGTTTMLKTRTSQLACSGLHKTGMAEQLPSKTHLEAPPQISCLATGQQLDKVTCLITIVLLFENILAFHNICAHPVPSLLHCQWGQSCSPSRTSCPTGLLWTFGSNIFLPGSPDQVFPRKC